MHARAIVWNAAAAVMSAVRTISVLPFIVLKPAYPVRVAPLTGRSKSAAVNAGLGFAC